MMEENPFAKEYRAARRDIKLTMELEVVCFFLSKTETPRPLEKCGDKGSRALVSNALQQVKDQAKVSGRELQKNISKQLETVRILERVTAKGVDRKSCMDSTMPGGAVGQLLQEIQRQTRLLQGEPRDLPYQMILVRIET